MKVPKCKECEYLTQYKIGKRTFYDCYHPIYSYCTGMRIYAKRMKPSPQWCPLRDEK